MRSGRRVRRDGSGAYNDGEEGTLERKAVARMFADAASLCAWLDARWREQDAERHIEVCKSVPVFGSFDSHLNSIISVF